MTREEMIQEITQLPDDTLEAILSLINATGIKRSGAERSKSDPENRKKRPTETLRGKIIMHDDFDNP